MEEKNYYDRVVIDKIKPNNITIALHEAVFPGTGHFLRDFLNEFSTNKVLFISHPLLYVEEARIESSYFELFKNSKKIRRIKSYFWRLPEPFLYIKDIVYTIVWSIQNNFNANLFIGFNPLNAISGLCLRELGLVDKVVYWSIDYFPVRFKNRYMNKLYHFIDKLCVRYADETWNVSSEMEKAREKHNNMDRKIYNRQYTFPIGIWFYKAKRKKFSDINKTKMIYTGILKPFMGLSLPIYAMTKIIKKVPDVKFEIIGGGVGLENLKKLVKKLRLERYVKFHGWISNREKLEYLLSDAALGIATFDTDILKNDENMKNADPSKIKDYIQMGLPIITTNAILIARKLEKAKCAIVIDYDVKEFTSAAIKLLTNETLLEKYRKNALLFAEQFDYGKLFCKNLERVLRKK